MQNNAQLAAAGPPGPGTAGPGHSHSPQRTDTSHASPHHMATVSSTTPPTGSTENATKTLTISAKSSTSQQQQQSSSPSNNRVESLLQQQGPPVDSPELASSASKSYHQLHSADQSQRPAANGSYNRSNPSTDGYSRAPQMVLSPSRQHAATISEPMNLPHSLPHPPTTVAAAAAAATGGGPHNSHQPQPQQHVFRYYQQQPPRSSTGTQDGMMPPPRRMSYVGNTPPQQQQPHDRYRASPPNPYYSARQPPPPPVAISYGAGHPQQQGYYHPHGPPGSAPPHQLHFAPYGPPRGSISSGSNVPLKRSLSPQPHHRRYLPPPQKQQQQQQRSPLPFPRIPSPSQSAVAAAAAAGSAGGGGTIPSSSSSAAAMLKPSAATAAGKAINTSQSPARGESSSSTRRLSSVVWGPTGFERLESGMSRCRICGKEYSKGSSTGTLKRHFRQHQVNVTTAGGPSASAAAVPAGSRVPYPPPPTAGGHPASRPRAYSHRTTRRELSPIASITPLIQQQQQSYYRKQQQQQQQQGPLPSYRNVMAISSQQQQPPPPHALRPINQGIPPTSVASVDTNSVIAGSALLSMAASGGRQRQQDDSRMPVDDGQYRPLRMSDPSVYTPADPNSTADGGDTRDMSVSPSPSSSSTTTTNIRSHQLPSHSRFGDGTVRRNGEMMGGVSSALRSTVMSPGGSQTDLYGYPYGQQQQQQQQQILMKRRATVTGIQRVPPPPPPPPPPLPLPQTKVSNDITRIMEGLSASEMVALSSELVRRVAGALPQLAQDATSSVHMNGGTIDHNNHSDWVTLLLEHVRERLTQETTLSSSSSSVPYTIRKQEPLSLHNNMASVTRTASVGLLSRVSASMQRIAPLSLAAREWDNVGILVEAPKPRMSANKVFMTIDLTSATLDEALEDPQVGVIVAYHPPIFFAWKSLSMCDLKQSLVLKCAAAGVSIYSPHTSLDSCANGINDWLASILKGKNKVEPIVAATQENAAGQENVGEGRVVELTEPCSLTKIVDMVKTGLGLKHLRVARAACHHQGDDEKLISRVAVCAGSGGSVVSKTKEPVDLYVTGEMDHHSVLAAMEKSTSCILAEHTNTERGYLEKILMGRLQEELDADDLESKATVVVSRLDKDPIFIE